VSLDELIFLQFLLFFIQCAIIFWIGSEVRALRRGLIEYAAKHSRLNTGEESK
jgi:hypothetical protein